MSNVASVGSAAASYPGVSQCKVKLNKKAPGYEVKSTQKHWIFRYMKRENFERRPFLRKLVVTSRRKAFKSFISFQIVKDPMFSRERIMNTSPSLSGLLCVNEVHISTLFENMATRHADSTASQAKTNSPSLKFLNLCSSACAHS